MTSIEGYVFYDCSNIRDVTTYITEPFTCTALFSDETYRQGTLNIPTGTKELYTRFDGWREFLNIVEMDENDKPDIPGAERCDIPIIRYENENLFFECNTNGVKFVTNITDDDIKKHYDSTIPLTATYNISVYATKSGYNNSETATATLCWIDVNPKTEGIENSIANIRAKAVLIQSNRSSLDFSGADAGTPITIYDTAGRLVASAKASSGSTIIGTSLNTGDIAIVKIGDKTVKVVVK